MSSLTRRRFVAIAAAALSAPLSRSAPAATTRWSGRALGAPGMIAIDGLDPLTAHEAITAARAEIDRLEALFSLYRPDSAIVRLNETGELADPAPDFLQLLTLSRAIHRATSGAFDPTVQPLWRVMAAARETGTRDDDPALVRSIETARTLIGFEDVLISPQRISFTRSGMAITLNGIAQGYITDLVADRLRALGLVHVLVDIGEIVAIGGQSDGRPWPVAIARRHGGPQAIRRITLADRALATSEPLTTTLDQAGRIGHILDPRHQLGSRKRALVTIEADRAAIADGLSTALCHMDASDIPAALGIFPGTRLIA